MFKKINTIYSRVVAKLSLKKCGNNFRLGHTSHIKGYKNIEIGNNFFAGPFLYLNTNEISSIAIGDDVGMGPSVKIISGNHIINYIHGPMNQSPPKKPGHDKGIIIENDVWIGVSTIVLDGAHISEGAVIGAGSIVNKFIPPYCVAVGNPIRIVKSRFTTSELTTLLNAKKSKLTIDHIIKELNKHEIKLI